MSRFVTQEGDKFIEEIESMDVCKYMINDVCCNEECEHLGSYPFVDCDSKLACKCFEEEDGIIGDD